MTNLNKDTHFVTKQNLWHLWQKIIDDHNKYIHFGHNESGSHWNTWKHIIYTYYEQNKSDYY